MESKAQEKAKELVSKFSSKLPYYSEKDNLTKAKQCALICLDEIEEWIDRGFDTLDELRKEINKL